MTEKKKGEENETKKKKTNISGKVDDPEFGQSRNALPRGQSIEGYETTPPGRRKAKHLRIIEIAVLYKKENARKQRQNITTCTQ